MRYILTVSILLLAASFTAAQAPTLNLTNPAVNQGSTANFSCASNCGTGGTWSCSGCAGSINSGTGVYTAPSTVTAQESLGGCQVMPNNHIYNVDTSSLSAVSNSSTLLAAFPSGWKFNFFIAWPYNYVTNSTPTQNMIFNYTTPNNGAFWIPQAPFARSESGYLSLTTYDPLSSSQDHHFFALNTQTCQLQEMYDFYTPGTNGTCPTCNSQSGVIYSTNGYAQPANGTTAAGGVLLSPLTLRLHELEVAVANSSYVHHALSMTMGSGYSASSSKWPATGGGGPPANTNFYGELVRLKSSFSLTGYSAIQQAILKTIQHYGVYLVDNGGNGTINTEYARWPLAYSQAMGGLNNTIANSNYEVIDPTSLEITSSSGEANTGRETVTYTASTGSVSTDVVLVGPVVNLQNDFMYFQAGSPAVQIPYYNNMGTVTFSMSPTVGTLTSGGTYTPPATVSSPTTTTVTATSSLSASVIDVMSITVFPTGVIRIAPGLTSNYTDSLGKTWYSGELVGCDAAGDFNTLSAYGYNAGGTWSGVDIQLYEIPIYSNDNDIRCDFHVSNGTYAIVGKYANAAGTPGSNLGSMVIEPQGVDGSLISIYTLAGGSNKPWDISTGNITVSTGLLSYVIRRDQTSFISALQITPIPPPTPASSVSLGVTFSKGVSVQ